MVVVDTVLRQFRNEMSNHSTERVMLMFENNDPLLLKPTLNLSDSVKKANMR